MNMSGSLSMDINQVCEFEFILSIASLLDTKLSFHVDLHLFNDSSVPDPRSFLVYSSDETEQFYGFGESFSYFNLKGLRVPVLVSEQGVGRGEQPITDYLNTEVARGVGGDWYTTYAPKPIYMTSYNNCLVLAGSDVSFFDLRQPDRVAVEVWDSSFGGWLVAGLSLLDLVEGVTSITGRQSVLPEWTQRGAVVGLEGGTANVSAIVRSLQEHGVPLAGEPGPDLHLRR